MNTLISKLRSRAGESLIESLLSILVFTLASVAMYTMVMTAADINADAKELDRNMHEQITVAEMAEGEGKEGKVSISLLSGEDYTRIDEIEVHIYRKDENSMYAYYTDTIAQVTEPSETTETTEG